ncbi:MAG: acetyl-CoA hydrolase/transferase family protein [Acidimicrobiales bacterium]|nr:hypothetical protein [Acidimicrobiaceae bacterium]MYA24887.1 acetyl-CoA hydrolase/transferase family protein [Acidimicrobiales bacterium]MYD83562.1 acetyl-CoA hydrolase/transferase family protein [Acidimicrobiales bacterium]MYJ66845.1 acetyl-CoA hydrolase/transferase family protein [Acidimicrobiales bacterium]
MNPDRPSERQGNRAGVQLGADEAIERIGRRARVYVAQGSAAPYGLLAAIDAAHDRFAELEFVSAFLLDRPAPLDHLGNPFRWTSLQPSGALRDALDSPHFGVVPARYSDITGLVGPGGGLEADVLLCQVSPPDADGRMSLGTGVGGHVDLLRSTPLVIAQVNPHMPYVHGAGECHRTDFDGLVEVDEPLPELAPAVVDETAAAIAAHVGQFIGDGTTLQFGIGSIPDAVLSSLADRRHLGLHGGMINDACIDLIDSGAVDNRHKGPVGDGVSVAAEVMGTRRLYDWVDGNPAVQLVNGALSHGIEGIAQIRNFVALQSTVQMALDGSANSEMIAGRYISGPGGAPDFAFGACVATGGRSIVAMPSTAARGRISRIVPRLEPGAPTTLPAYTADIVATEFGAVELRGRSLEERANLLTSIAHPDFRDDLSGGPQMP